MHKLIKKNLLETLGWFKWEKWILSVSLTLLQTWCLSVHMGIMEIIWGIPLSLNRLPNTYPLHTSCPALYKSFEPKPQLIGHKPWPKIRIITLALGRRNRRISLERRSVHCEASNVLQKRKEKKVPGQRSEESNRKRKFPVKDRKKAKEKENSRSRSEEN